MRQPEQGALVQCVYCTEIHPELKNKKECPQCNGKVEYFRPMRMMDKYTSEIEVLNKIFWINPEKDPSELKQALLSLLTDVMVYNFDIKDALINYIHYLEEQEDYEKNG